MNNRLRALAAIIKGDSILMVRINNGEKDFWTLPGGGLEDEETYEDAVIREVQEEVNVKVKVVKHLYTNNYEFGVEKCFLVELISQNETPTLGIDPELPNSEQELKEIKWKQIKEMTEDIQVAEVIQALGLEIR